MTFTDPAPAATFAHLDATTVLSRKIVEQGIYPAVDPLESSSRILEPGLSGRSIMKRQRGTGNSSGNIKELGYYCNTWYGGIVRNR